MVKIPCASNGQITVHKDAVLPAHGSVEILQGEALLTPGPFGESPRTTQKSRILVELNISLPRGQRILQRFPARFNHVNGYLRQVALVKPRPPGSN
jgi:hypothetical protein